MSNKTTITEVCGEETALWGSQAALQKEQELLAKSTPPAPVTASEGIPFDAIDLVTGQPFTASEWRNKAGRWQMLCEAAIDNNLAANKRAESAERTIAKLTAELVTSGGGGGG